MRRFNVLTRAAPLACSLTLALAGVALASGPAPTNSQAKYEVRFMTEMMDHHAMGVEMAQICLSNAVHEELRTLCNQLITAQTQEISTMQMWLQSWYGVNYAPQMTPGMEQQLERMAAMSGAEFEITFMETLIRHHWKAIVRAADCVDKAYHLELIDMCASIVEAQAAEITTLRTWLCQWYGVCHYGPKGAVGETN